MSSTIAVCSLILLLAACGGRPDAQPGPASPTDPTTAEAPPATVAPQPPAPSAAEAACSQLIAIDQRDACGFEAGSVAACTEEMESELESLAPQQTAIYERAFECLASGSSCGDHERCFMDASVALEALETGNAAPAASELPCNRADELGPAQVSPGEYAARHGAGVTRLPELTSSKEQPVEVCGVAAQHDFLLAAQCADGSRPFTTRDQVRGARLGNVGPGGRCGAYVDHYQVACPEATYEVFMDLYYCQAGQSI